MCSTRRCRSRQLAAHQRDAPRPPAARSSAAATTSRSTSSPCSARSTAAARCRSASWPPHEKVKPPSMTRTVACLEEAGLVTRRPHDTDGRQVVVELTDAARDVLADDRRRRDAWLAQRLGALDADELELLHRVAPLLERLAGDMRSTFAALRVRNYRLFAAGVARLQRRHVDAARRPGLARPHAHRQRRRARPHHRACSSCRSCCSRRSPASSPTATRSAASWRCTQATMGVDRRRARRPRRDRARSQAWHVYVLAFLFGTGHGVRRPGPPGVRQRDGRPRPAGQRRRPQLGVVQPRPHDRPGARRRAHRLDGLGRRGDRLGDPASTPAATSP